MDINIVGLGLGITDRFREYASEKAEKVSHLADRAQAIEIKVTRHNEKVTKDKGGDRVELTLIGPGPVVRAEAGGADKYAAFDVALGRLLERVRRARDRRKLHRGGARRPTSLHEATTGGFSAVGVVPAGPEALSGKTATAVLEHETENGNDGEEEYTPVVIRRKLFSSTPMAVDDALYYMELVGHDFYLFIDKETDRPSVVYRRKGWDYGVISLDDGAEEVQEEAVANRRDSR